MSLGLKMAARELKTTVEHRWAVDIDSDATKTYKRNFPESEVHNVDIRRLKLSQLAPVDALAFGFPCNDFSLVGQQRGVEGDFGPLYKNCISAIKHFSPKWFVAENVGGIRSANSGRAFVQILSEFSELGYRITSHLFRFENYGVPQRRHRVMIVGIRNDLNKIFAVPAPRFPERTAREALEKPRIPKKAKNQELTRQSNAVIERLKALKPGQNAFSPDLPEKHRLNIRGATISQIYRRLDPNKPAYTVTGSGGGGTHVYHWEEPRALTNRERARLQAFPDDYVFDGGKEAVRRQIGMAVPPLGAAEVFRAVLMTVAGKKYAAIPEYLGGRHSSLPNQKPRG